LRAAWRNYNNKTTSGASLFNRPSASVFKRRSHFLPEVKHLLSARSRLRACVLDALHKEGIEIVSPIFMNQRQLSEKAIVMSQPVQPQTPVPEHEDLAPEDMMFDKAERAEQRQLLDKLSQDITNLEGQIGEGDDENQRDLEAQIQQLHEQRVQIEQNLAELPDESGS
jgi:septal ring factor EnvC (AmiA/AmiB activator)